MRRRTLLVSEARGRSLVRWEGRVVVVGLVRGGRWVAVVVVGGVVWGLLLHAGVGGLLKNTRCYQHDIPFE